jgi:hypothetical protein
MNATFMERITPPPAAMTTRKHFVCATAVICAVLGGAGCATPGPLHAYTAVSAQVSSISDRNDTTAAEVPSFLASSETLTGFAYDPFTDHLFLRLAPGNRIRVVDRPARAIKREFVAEGVPATGGGDLAVRPRDGHLFFVHPTELAVVETSRFGKLVRSIRLDAATALAPPVGLAYDSVRDQLLVLEGGGLGRVTVHDLDGRRVGEVGLAEPVASGSLAFDSEKRELYVPLAGGQALGVFDESGKLRRTIPAPAVFVDVGPRSFLRVF